MASVFRFPYLSWSAKADHPVSARPRANDSLVGADAPLGGPVKPDHDSGGVMIRWRDGIAYSAASRMGEIVRPPYSRMRRSISGRKWRSRPWTGHEAPSPKAQI